MELPGDVTRALDLLGANRKLLRRIGLAELWQLQHEESEASANIRLAPDALKPPNFEKENTAQLRV